MSGPLAKNQLGLVCRSVVTAIFRRRGARAGEGEEEAEGKKTSGDAQIHDELQAYLRVVSAVSRRSSLDWPAVSPSVGQRDDC